MARVFSAILAAFGLLIGFATWWQVVQAPSLRDKQSNQQAAYYELRVQRGDIVAGGTRVASTSKKTGENGDTIFSRTYPASGLAAHYVGYSTVGKSRTGLERTQNDYLTSSNDALAQLVDRLQGNEYVRGSRLHLTLNPRAQRVAETSLAGKKGAVVALDPSSGRLLVLASAPGFDQNKVENDFAEISSDPDGPLINRATQGLYPPGSIFKVVTAAAALEEEVAEPDTSFPGGCRLTGLAGPDIANFGGACFGSHDLTYALTHSVNTTFGRLGEQLGGDKLREQMRRFGFESLPPLDEVPSNEKTASGLYAEGTRNRLDDDEAVDAARVAIGQERLLVTPLQMALVAAAIANEGTLMRPFGIDRIVDPDGRVRQRGEPAEYADVISESTARELTSMMRDVVREGTGVAAAMEGIEVAGKTGTADTPGGNQIWFLAFAPAQNPKVAICVTLEAQSEGVTGGAVAAPIARAVMEEVLR